MKLLLFKCVVLLMLACSCQTYDTTALYKYQNPDSMGDGLEVASLEEVQISRRPIEAAVNRIQSGQYSEVHSMLIYKNGKLVLEEYFTGHDYQWDAPGHYATLRSWDTDKPHYVHSVSKSVTSMLTGIAIDHGFIDHVQQSIFDYLPDYQYLKTENKEQITIEHLLTGTSGLQWAEWNAPLSSVANDQVGIYYHEKGPVDFVLSRPLKRMPGTNFVYSGGNFEVLGVMLENASGMSFKKFSRKYLFDPLGLDSAQWAQVYLSGEVHAAGSLRITPREMVKIGACMLNQGSWKGKRILSEDWVKKSALPYPGNKGINIPGEPSGKQGYSYSWWTKTYYQGGRRIQMYAAGGWGGQHIMVIPEVSMVVVFTGANYNSRRPPYMILKKYILPALQ